MKLAIKYRGSFFLARDVAEPTVNRLFYGIECNDGQGKGWVPCCDGANRLCFSSADERDRALRDLRLREFRERSRLHMAFALELGMAPSTHFAI